MRCGQDLCALHSVLYGPDHRFRHCVGRCPPASAEADALGIRGPAFPVVRYRTGKVLKAGQEIVSRVLSNKEWRGARVVSATDAEETILEKGQATLVLYKTAFALEEK